MKKEGFIEDFLGRNYLCPERANSFHPRGRGRVGSATSFKPGERALEDHLERLLCVLSGWQERRRSVRYWTGAQLPSRKPKWSAWENRMASAVLGSVCASRDCWNMRCLSISFGPM